MLLEFNLEQETLYTCTVGPRSLDPFYIVTCYIKWVKTSTDNILRRSSAKFQNPSN